MRMYFTAASMIIVAFAGISASNSATAMVPGKRESNNMVIPLAKYEYSFLKDDDSVDFDALNAHCEYVMTKIAYGLENYERNTGTRHPSAKNASVIRKRGASVTLTNWKKGMWYAPITIGTPPKSFKIWPDTGSADLVVPSATCDASCDGHVHLDSSTSAKNLNKACKLDYEMGSVTGTQYTDNVTIAGFTANDQTLCAATTYTSRFNINRFLPDGLLGLGFPQLSAYRARPLFGTLVSQKTVTNQVFSFYLSPSGGELYIGGANRDRYQGDLTYTPVTVTQGFWQVMMESVQGKGRTITSLNNIKSLIDTGSPVIMGDETRVRQLHTALGGTDIGGGSYTYPCNSFPSVSLTFNGQSFPISTATQKLGPVRSGSSTCVSGIMGSDSMAVDGWIIGAVFLQNVYTSFDYGNNKVGFAKLCSKKPGSSKCTIL